MTDQKHPIIPPPELVQQWRDEFFEEAFKNETWFIYLANKAARWGADQQLKLDAEQIAQAYQKGADQELEACCTWLSDHGYIAADPELRTSRRPKPPSLKEQALALLQPGEPRLFNSEMQDIIRRAIEALPND